MREQLLIISGVSGSGKSVALNALEDAGFYCIDNLPVALLSSLGDEVDINKQRLAISLDARNFSRNIDSIKPILLEQKKFFKDCSLIYLDCDENILLKRYTETRRKHPLSDENLTLREAIVKERDIMAPVADLADCSINSSTINAHELHYIIRQHINSNSNDDLLITVKSFGFKHGVPSEADYIFDVRCLPNPYWQIDLRNHSGLEDKVIDFLSKQESVGEIIDDIHTFLNKWLETFALTNRSYITVAIGCTGGVHRSVFVSENIGKKLKENFKNVMIRHREIGDEKST